MPCRPRCRRSAPECSTSARSLPTLGTAYDERSWVTLTNFVLGAIVFAAIWSRFFRRGPLEYLLNAATRPAKHIR